MYLALARKYRPQFFCDLIGQPHITRTLQNAIAMKKLYPSLIFSGMKGVGKTSAARILAKALNCEKGPATEPCNQCPTCQEITEDKSPDYIEIDGASNNGVEEVRNLREKVKYKPIKNRYRVVVIDEVHMLSNAAWNALLKTVEEPPDNTYFIMATTDFHKIPATIVSRCQHFEFKRISLDIIKNLLQQISAKENIKVSDHALYLIAKAGEGSLRDSKKILDQSIALSKGDVQDEEVIAILGIIEEEIFIRLARSILEQNRKEIIEQINQICERGMDLRFFYNEFLKFLRNLMILKTLGDVGSMHNLNPENVAQLNKLLEPVSEIELLRYFNAAKDMEITVKNTENPRIIIEFLLLKLSYFPHLVSIEQVIQQLGDRKPPSIEKDQTQRSGAQQPDIPASKNIDSVVPAPVKREAAPPHESGADLSPEIQRAVMEKVDEERPRLAHALKSAIWQSQKQSLVLKFFRRNEIAYKNVRENLDFLKTILANFDSRYRDIQMVLDDSDAAADEKSSLEEKKIKEIESDHNINNLKEKIKGRIIKIDNVKGGTHA